MLGDKYQEQQKNLDKEPLFNTVLEYKNKVEQARRDYLPDYDKLSDADTEEYLKNLTHYHSF